MYCPTPAESAAVFSDAVNAFRDLAVEMTLYLCHVAPGVGQERASMTTYIQRITRFLVEAKYKPTNSIECIHGYSCGSEWTSRAAYVDAAAQAYAAAWQDPASGLSQCACADGVPGEVQFEHWVEVWDQIWDTVDTVNCPVSGVCFFYV